MYLTDLEYFQIIRIARFEFEKNPGWKVNGGWGKEFSKDFKPMTKESMEQYLQQVGRCQLMISPLNFKKRMKRFSQTALALNTSTVSRLSLLLF